MRVLFTLESDRHMESLTHTHKSHFLIRRWILKFHNVQIIFKLLVWKLSQKNFNENIIDTYFNQSILERWLRSRHEQWESVVVNCMNRTMQCRGLWVSWALQTFEPARVAQSTLELKWCFVQWLENFMELHRIENSFTGIVKAQISGDIGVHSWKI